MKDRVRILGLPLDPVEMETAVDWVRLRLSGSRPSQVVTLNPEIVVRSRSDEALARAIRSAELVTPDGVGVLWAARRLCGLDLRERVTGVDLTQELFARLGDELRVYFLGGRPGIAARAAERSRNDYGLRIAGFQHGFFDDEAAVVEAVRASGANLLLAGLGARQEVFLHEHKEKLGVGVMIGVGGTLDVLAGAARRMPAWSRRWGLEWLLRVGGDPKRWGRGLRLLRFAWRVMLEKQSDCQNE